MDKKFEIKYINSYDGIRAIAVFGVLFFHMLPDKVPGGFLGVVIFLVMAGFLSMKKVMEQDRYAVKKSAFKLIDKRITKLFPLLVFFIVSIDIFLYIFMSQYLPAVKYQAISGMFFVNNIAQILHGESYFESMSFLKPFTHLWALSLEMQLYVLFYLIVAKRYKRENKKRFLYLFYFLIIISVSLMAGIYLKTADVTRIYYSIDTRMFSFFIGAAGALHVIDENEMVKKYSKNSFLAGFFIIFTIIFSFFCLESSKEMYLYQMFLFSVITVLLLIFSIDNDSHLSKFLNMKALKYIGKRGYPIYLWHYPVIKISNKIFAYREKNVILFSLFQIILSLIISELTYRIFVKRNLGKKKYGKILALFLCASVILFPYKAHGEGLKDLQDLKSMQDKITDKDDKEKDKDQIKTVTEPQLKTEIKNTTKKQLEVKEEKKEENNKKEVETQKSKQKENPPQEKKAQVDYQSLKNTQDMIEKFSSIYPSASLSKEDYEAFKDTKVSLVGDSVGEMAAPYLKKFLPNITVDAKVSRQMYKGYEPYKRMKDSGNLGKVLILELGTNGNFQLSYAQKIIEDAKVPVVLVSVIIPESVESTINKNLYALADMYDNVYIADWHGLCKGQKELFYGDATHPNDKGSKVYAYLVTQKVIEAIKNS